MTATPRIQRRYPKSSLGSVGVFVFGIATTIVGIVLLVQTSLFHANPTLVARVDSFKIVSNDLAHASVSIQKSGVDVSGTCTLIAEAITFDRVGEVDVKVGKGTTLTTVDVRIKTVKRATSVSVAKCVPS